MTQKIIAIGGSNINKKNTLPIDKEIVNLSNQLHPKLLFIPTASSDNTDYCTRASNYFSKLGCIVDTLLLFDKKLPYDTIKTKILSTDIIYVGGGNTLKMMNLWRKLGIDILLELARKKGIVLSGVSAGSICWFNNGNSDSRKSINPDADYIKVTGLGFIDALNCPHYNSEYERKSSLKKMMKRSSGVAIALEDCCALEVVGNHYRIISSKKAAHAYKIYWKNNRFFETNIEKNDEFQPLKMLLATS